MEFWPIYTHSIRWIATHEGVKIQQRGQYSTAKEVHNSTKIPLNIYPWSEFSRGVQLYLTLALCGTFYTPVLSRDVLLYGDVRPPGSPSVSHSFPHFSPTCFDILSWNFVSHFLLMNIRSSSSVVIFRQFLLELCPFWNLEYSKYTVVRTFLIHALTYWAEILLMTLLYCTTVQVRVSSICVNVCRRYAPFGT